MDYDPMAVELDEEKLLQEYQERETLGKLSQLDPKEREQLQGQLQGVNAEQPVDNLQEAASIIPDAASSIVEDIQKFGNPNEEWQKTDEDVDPTLKTEWGKILSGLIQTAGPTIAAAVGARFGLRKLPFAKNIRPGSWTDLLSTAALETGIDVGWAGISRQGFDDTFSTFAESKGLDMPDPLVNKDSDSPEIKRVRNQWEAAGFGTLITGLSALFKITKPGRFISKIIPKSRAAKELVENIKAKSPEVYPDPWEDAVAKDVKLRQDADDEMALTRYARDPEFTKMDRYVQSELFEDFERASRAVPPEGVIEAMTDNVKILRDPLGNGRMQRFYTDAAIEGLAGSSSTAKTVLKGLRTQIEGIAKAPFTVDAVGKEVTNKDLVKNVGTLVKDLFGQEKIDDALRMLEFDDVSVTGGQRISVLSPDSQKAAALVVKKIMQEYPESEAKALALMQTQIANDLSDSAVASNLVKAQGLPIERVQERMLDLAEAFGRLDSVSGSYLAWALQSRKAVFDKPPAAEVAKWWKKAEEDALKVRKLTKEVNEIGKTNPLLKDAIVGAYELTNGSIKDVRMLQQAIFDSMKFRRLVANSGYDSAPLAVEGISSIFYAMKLSSLYTPITAFANNISNYIMRPITRVLGSWGGEFSRTWVQYVNGSMDLNRITATIMSERFKQIQSLPTEKLFRSDFAERIQKQQEWIQAAENLAESTGDLLFQNKINGVKTMMALGNSRIARNSTNMMEAGDAATNVGLILVEKRGEMFDKIFKETGKVTPKDVESINAWIRANGKEYVMSQLDENFKPKNKGILYAGQEIAMNLDGETTKSIGSLLNKSPILKTAILFPKTMINALAFPFKFSLLSQDLWKAKTLTNPEAIGKFLGSKGIEFTEDNWRMFKAEAEGRAILGSSIAGYGLSMYFAGNITGGGLYDKAANQSATDVAQRPKYSWRAYEGAPWISYEGIEPIATILGIVVTTAENFETLGASQSEKFWQAAAFIVGDNLTNKSFVRGLRPLFEFASGKTGWLESFGANLTSIGIVNAAGQSWDSAGRIVTNDLMSKIRSKYNILDQAGIGEPLASDYSVVTGEKIGNLNFPGVSLFPARMQRSQTPEEEFLTEIEFASSGSFETSLGRVEYTGAQISAIKQWIGTNGDFRRTVRKIMKSERAKEDLAYYRQLRRQGVSGEDVKWRESWTYRQIEKSFRANISSAKKAIRDDALLEQENQSYQLRRGSRTSDYKLIEQLLRNQNK